MDIKASGSQFFCGCWLEVSVPLQVNLPPGDAHSLATRFPGTEPLRGRESKHPRWSPFSQSDLGGTCAVYMSAVYEGAAAAQLPPLLPVEKVGPLLEELLPFQEMP